MLLNIKYNINIDRMTLNSYFEQSLDQDIIEKIINCSDQVQEILDHVDIVDNIHNPTGAYKYLQAYSKEIGQHKTKKLSFYDDNIKATITKEVYSHYEQNDPDLFVIVATDHISLFETESTDGQKLNHHQTLAKWSSDYCRKQITKNWNWIVLNVQQVGMSSDDVNAFKAGKLEPSISDAGNNKEIIRDDMLVMALFDPTKHDLKVHRGYDMKRLNGNYRSFSVIKNRYGVSPIKIGLEFNGASGLFKEMPDLGTKELENLYNKFQKS